MYCSSRICQREFMSIHQLKTLIFRFLLQHHRGRHVLVRHTASHKYTVYCTGGGHDERRKRRGFGAPLPERKCTFQINFCNPLLRRQSRLSAKEKKTRASDAATAAVSSPPLADDANESDDTDDADASHDVNASEEVMVRLSPRWVCPNATVHRITIASHLYHIIYAPRSIPISHLQLPLLPAKRKGGRPMNPNLPDAWRLGSKSVSEHTSTTFFVLWQSTVAALAMALKCENWTYCF